MVPHHNHNSQAPIWKGKKLGTAYLKINKCKRSENVLKEHPCPSSWPMARCRSQVHKSAHVQPAALPTTDIMGTSRGQIATIKPLIVLKKQTTRSFQRWVRSTRNIHNWSHSSFNGHQIRTLMSQAIYGGSHHLSWIPLFSLNNIFPLL